MNNQPEQKTEMIMNDCEAKCEVKAETPAEVKKMVQLDANDLRLVIREFLDTCIEHHLQILAKNNKSKEEEEIKQEKQVKQQIKVQSKKQIEVQQKKRGRPPKQKLEDENQCQEKYQEVKKQVKSDDNRQSINIRLEKQANKKCQSDKINFKQNLIQKNKQKLKLQNSTTEDDM